MQDAIVGSWAQEPQLPPATLESLRALNHRFLDLAAERTNDWVACGGGSSLRLAGQVAPLSAVQRAAAAGCPYALFDLRFQDDGHWRVRLQNLGAWRVADESVADDDTVNFVRLALFYAWHVASGAGIAPQLLLGMNGDTATALRRITVVGPRGFTGALRRLPVAHAATTATTASAAPAASPAGATLGTVTARLARGRSRRCSAGSLRARGLITGRGFARRAAVSLARRPTITATPRLAVSFA